jgi:hypothetical protein
VASKGRVGDAETATYIYVSSYYNICVIILYLSPICVLTPVGVRTQITSLAQGDADPSKVQRRSQ